MILLWADTLLGGDVDLPFPEKHMKKVTGEMQRESSYLHQEGALLAPRKWSPGVSLGTVWKGLFTPIYT